MYQSIQLENLSKECLIKISCVSTGVAPGDINKVRLKRRNHGEILWKLLKEIPITSVSDFTFTVYDNQTKSRRTYDYMVIPVTNDMEGIGIIGTVKCEFDGIYISDVYEEWICRLNPTYEYEKNISVGYIRTLHGRYPKRIRNGNSNYATGNVRGLFLPLDSSGDFVNMPEIVQAAQEYKERLLEFLCNGRKKLLRIYDGHMWPISIDDKPKEVFSRFDGASETQFNWTEIDSVPSTEPDMAEESPYGIITPPSLSNLDNALILDGGTPSLIGG